MKPNPQLSMAVTKRTTGAAIGAAALVGPLVTPRAETAIVASSFAQARIAFDHVLAFLRPHMATSPHA